VQCPRVRRRQLGFLGTAASALARWGVAVAVRKERRKEKTVRTRPSARRAVRQKRNHKDRRVPKACADQKVSGGATQEKNVGWWVGRSWIQKMYGGIRRFCFCRPLEPQTSSPKCQTRAPGRPKRASFSNNQQSVLVGLSVLVWIRRKQQSCHAPQSTAHAQPTVAVRGAPYCMLHAA
jgi:hypothetical protein